MRSDNHAVEVDTLPERELTRDERRLLGNDRVDRLQREREVREAMVNGQDDRAWQLLDGLYGQHYRTRARFRLGSSQWAERAVAEMWNRAWERRAARRDADGPHYYWLNGILLNVCRELARERANEEKRTVLTPESEAYDTVVDQLARTVCDPNGLYGFSSMTSYLDRVPNAQKRAGLLRDVRDALERLPGHLQELVWLRAVEGWEFPLLALVAEANEGKEVRINTVTQRYIRALKRLEDDLAARWLEPFDGPADISDSGRHLLGDLHAPQRDIS